MDFDVDQLNKRFSNKPVSITYTGDPALKNGVGICAWVRECDFGIAIDLEGGVTWFLTPETISSTFVSGKGRALVQGRCVEGSCTVTIISSLKYAHLQKLEYEAKAKQGWEDYAEYLASEIPDSSKIFAERRFWLKCNSSHEWWLPKFLINMITRVQSSDSQVSFTSSEFDRYGFSDFDHVVKAMAELQEAWNDCIHIRVEKINLNVSEGLDLIQIFFSVIDTESQKTV